MSQIRLLIVFALVIFLQTSYAQNWYGEGNPAPAKVTLVSSGQQSTVLKAEFSGFYYSNINYKGKNLLSLSCKGATPLLEKGSPELLKMAASIIIPDEASTKIKVITANYTEWKNVNIAPSKGNLTRDIDPASVPYIFGKSYRRNAFFPEKIVELHEPYVLRDYRGQAVVFYPLQYNPVTKTLRIYSEITVKIVASEGQGINILKRTQLPEKVDESFLPVYERHFLNFNTSKYTPLGENGKMLIISHPNFISAMQPFVDWKISRGIPTQLVSTAVAGTTASAIKSYVLNYYNTQGLTYLLLVGDAAYVPTNSLSSGHSDNAYGYLVGNDSYQEIFVGRFSAETVADVQTQVQRSINYEKNPSLTSGAYNRVIGIASNQGPGDDNEMDYEHIRNLQTKMLAYEYTSAAELFEGSQGGLDAPGDPTAAMVANEINAGAGAILYCGHGSDQSWGTSGFSNTNITALANGEMLPFIISIACVNGNFVNTTCFAEAWLRAQNNGQPRGAIATIMSTINQSWDPPMEGQDEMVAILTETYPANIKRTFAGVAINGCLKMNDAYGSQGYSMTDTWTIFGDPSILLRTDTTKLLTATHPPVAQVGISQFQIVCPVNGARATLSMNGQILGSTLVSGGMANITFNALTAVDTMKLVITAYNHKPYIQDIPIIVASGPFIVYNSSSINDTQTGNSNGAADYGETIKLNVELKNLGVATANGITVILRSNSPYVTLIDTVKTFGNISAGGTNLQNNAFTVQIANNVPDQEDLMFALHITDNNSNSWNSPFILKASAPVLNALELVVDDANGNNDGIFNPGETVIIKVKLKNSGHSDAAQFSTWILPVSTYITSNASPLNLAGLSANQDTLVSYGSFTANSSLTSGTTLVFNLFISMGAYQYNTAFFHKTTKVDEDFETNNFNRFQWVQGGNKPWTIVSTGAFQGSYCAKSGLSGDSDNNKNSTLSITLNILSSSDSVSFYRKVSSEQDYDFLYFYIDNVKKDEWSGTKSWEKFSYPVAAGQRTFQWEYKKDYYVSSGSDCAWLDNMVFPPYATFAGICPNDITPSLDVKTYPNPFMDVLNVGFILKQSGFVTISVYNNLGVCVSKETYRGVSGPNQFNISASDWENGVYFIQLTTPDSQYSGKVILQR